MRVWLILVLVFVGCTAANACDRFEYSSLTVHEVIQQQNNTVVNKTLYTYWDEGSLNASWQDNRRIEGSIKKDLKAYFHIDTVGKIYMLNSLGSHGWEAFSHQHVNISAHQSTDIWYLKRCL